MNRNDLAIKGSFIGIVSQIINLVIKFVVRTFIIRFLGRDILGLDGVIIDTVSMLSLADMGITSAMLFRLYTPIIKKDKRRINDLMATYRTIYHCIAGVIASVGIIISFFLHRIISGINLPWSRIYIAFYMQLGCSVFSYLLAYQRILLNADQKKHYCMTVDLISNIIFSILKVVVIIKFKSYEIYLFLSIAQTISANAYLKLYTRKKYCDINSDGIKQNDDIKSILQDTKDLLGNKLAGIVYNSTDNIIISTFLGTGTVGLLSNYKYISSALRSLMNSAMATIQPIIGNYLHSNTSKDKSFVTLKRYTFVRYVFAGLTIIPFILVSNIFIRLWTGDSGYIMGEIVPILIAIDYYISCVYGPLGEYILAMGLFKKGKYPTYAGAICNIVLSLVGVAVWGINGVLFATIIGQLVIWGGDIFIVLKGYYAEYPVYSRMYIYMHIKFIIILVGCCILGRVFILSISFLPDILVFLFGIFVPETIFGIVLFLLYREKDELDFFKMMLFRIIVFFRKG